MAGDIFGAVHSESDHVAARGARLHVGREHREADARRRRRDPRQYVPRIRKLRHPPEVSQSRPELLCHPDDHDGTAAFRVYATRYSHCDVVDAVCSECCGVMRGMASVPCRMLAAGTAPWRIWSWEAERL